jgi:hypothetical protein
VRPSVRDPLQRRKDVLLRGDREVIDAADRLAARLRISRNDALNAMFREFLADPDPDLRLARFLQAATAAASATVEAIRQEARRS